MQSEKASFVVLLFHRKDGKCHLLPIHPFRLVACVPTAISVQFLGDRNLWQADILHDRPHDGQTAGFRREGVDLIRALPHITEKTFNRIGAANVTVHDRRKSVKGEEMFFILTKAADGFGVALLVFGFKCRKIEQCILFLLLFEDPGSFCADLFAFTMGNGVEHIALFMHHTALPGSG